MNARVVLSIAFVMVAAGCASPVIPTIPTEISPTVIAVPTPPAASSLTFEGENGTGDGDIRQRSQASGGRTVHLGPGERRSWSISIDSETAQYALAVRYSNGRYGPNEVITLIVDGHQTGSFQDRNTGEDTPEGWNAFVDDDGGLSTLPAGNHTVTLAVTGGDGCVEIDVVTLSPGVSR